MKIKNLFIVLMMNKEYTVIFVINFVLKKFLKIILNHKLILIILVNTENVSKKLIQKNMSYYCDVCDKTINCKSKSSLLKSLSHKEFDKYEHIVICLKDIDRNRVEEAFYLYIIEHYRKYDYYLIKCSFQLFFKDNQFCLYLTSKLSDNRTTISWSNLLQNVIDVFRKKYILSTM